jgi:hypothetical protein
MLLARLLAGGDVLGNKTVPDRIDKGSVTVEAAMVMPLFICIVVSIMFFVRVVYIHELVRRAASETAAEIASFSYLVHKPGIDDGVHEWLVKGFGEVVAGADGTYTGDSRANTVANTILETVKNAAVQKAAGEIENLMLMPLLHLLASRHLSDPSGMQGDYLERLGVVGGYNGLDFSGSSFCGNETEDINVVVRYDIRIPVPIKIFGDLHFEQKACARAWLEGDNPKSREEDIWSLDNFTRGRKIREIFGANLPWGFPGISSFKNGCAILIRSMDITAPTYHQPENVERTVIRYIDDLADYAGQVKPWGKEEIVILPEEIKSRKLLLVIPGNPAADGVTEALERCRVYAAGRGVWLDIRRYGYKKGNEPDESEPG